jgi:hypothetical protein
MRTRIVIGLLSSVTSMAFVIGVTSAFDAGRTLSRREAASLAGGGEVKGMKCDPDPLCSSPCNHNNEVSQCLGTSDPGTCFNESVSFNVQANNQVRCVTGAAGWVCNEGPLNTYCRVYALCYWDSEFQDCLTSRPPYSPCFPFPTFCNNGQG